MFRRRSFLAGIFIILILASSVSAVDLEAVGEQRVRSELARFGVDDVSEQDEILESLGDLPEESLDRLTKKCLVASDLIKCALEDPLIRDDEDVKKFIEGRRRSGLEVALERVESRTARSRLEDNLVRLQETKGFIYDEIVPADEMSVVAKRKVKLFSIFPITTIDTITYDEEGNIVKTEPNFWSRWFF